MPAITPPTRPQQPREWARALLDANGGTGDVLALLAVRGYFRDSMGVPGKNDRGIYDDAMFLISPNAYVTWNANTDPSRTGINPKIGKPYALLKPGRYLYKKGDHPLKQPNYPAFIQASDVTVIRDPGDGTPAWEETGRFGVNIHRGSRLSTSSEGCQTIWPDQWDAMRAVTYGEMARSGAKVIPLVVVEAQG
jgi:lysozyme